MLRSNRLSLPSITLTLLFPLFALEPGFSPRVEPYTISANAAARATFTSLEIKGVRHSIAYLSLLLFCRKIEPSFAYLFLGGIGQCFQQFWQEARLLGGFHTFGH